MALTNDQKIANKLDCKKDEMLELIQDMEELLNQAENKRAVEQAKSYWIPHLTMALTNDHQWLGGSMVNCEDTINKLNESDEDED